jgi:TetR/AcrR family transcriptional repressor of nem operon
MRTKGHEATAGGTAREILDVAERLAQTRGFNGFSYADISDELGITKASLHYHFRTKAELGRSLMARYHDAFSGALDEIDASGVPALEKLDRYTRLYAGVLAGDRMCLCGMLAAELSTLPEPMREEIRRFFDMNEAWLARVIGEGQASGAVRQRADALELARLLLGALEGAMLVARSYGDPDRFQVAARRLLAGVAATE